MVSRTVVYEIHSIRYYYHNGILTDTITVRIEYFSLRSFVQDLPLINSW